MSLMQRLWKAVLFIPYYIKELILSNIRVAKDVLRPHPQLSPGIVAVPIRLKSDSGIMALANLITMTPGTISIDVTEDKKVIYIHSLYIDDPQKLRDEITFGFEKRLLEIFK